MKHTLLLAAVLLAGASQAQLVQTGFESWTDNVPDGWHGSKTNIADNGVSQVTDNVHGGDLALGLSVTGTTHKRFTTLPLTVANNVEYTMSFWVRGSGQIRGGVFDNRTAQSGYGYGAYVTATATWTQVTQVIAAAADASDAEFILSVKAATADETANVVVDDVTVTEGSTVQATSIHAIQFTSNPDGASPLVDQQVFTGGIISAVDTITTSGGVHKNNFYLQDAPGAWNGVYVYDYIDSGNHPQIGDSITLSCTVTEYFGLTELGSLTSLTVVQSGLQPHAALDIQTGEVSSEALESVLVHVTSAACTVAPSGATFGKWNADDGSGDAIIGKVLYTTTPSPLLGQVFDVTGVVSYTSFDNVDDYNIQPRMTSDVQLATGIADAGVLGTVSVGPNPTTDLLNINLGQAAGQRVQYTITDVQGRTVQGGVLTNERSTLSMNGMANGLYHFTLLSNELVKSFAVQVLR